jgi:hypothetical protein
MQSMLVTDPKFDLLSIGYQAATIQRKVRAIERPDFLKIKSMTTNRITIHTTLKSIDAKTGKSVARIK